MKKSLLFLVVSALLWGGAATAQAEIVSGKFGADDENLTWTFNTETGALEISGKGSMGEDYFYAPWSGYSYDIVSVKIGDGVTTIGKSAFQNCKGLASITIPNSVTTIGYGAFSGCEGLKSVTIGKGVTTIGSYAFQWCNSLTEVWFNADSCTYGAYGGFEGCKALATVHIGDNVKRIPDNAFSGCFDLTSVTIGNSVTTIGERAFSGSNLTSITIPNSVTAIGNRAFASDKLKSFEGKFASTDNRCLVINDTLVSFAPSGLTQYTIPDNVKVIGDYAFSDCTDLTSVTIGEGVTAIGDDAFSWCDGLTSVTIPNSVITIGESAFYKCEGLTSITIPENVQTIGSGAFSGCDGLRSVTIDKSVQTIGSEAFYECSRLTSVTIPESVQTIGREAFAYSGLNEVWFNADSCISGGFSWCGQLKTVHIGKNVKRIPDEAFYFTRLTSITIPESVTTIGEWAFSGCNDLEKFEGKFASTDNRCLVVRDTLVAFAPSGLTQYTIPDNVKVIGNYAFSYCRGLTSVTIPESVTSIGEDAFYECESLTSVTVYNPTPVNLIYNAFGDVDCANCKLYVPKGSVELYKAAEGWKEFGEILPIDESSAITETQQDKADRHVTVYNLQGVLVLETDDAADLKTLQNGAYIVNGKTMIIAR